MSLQLYVERGARAGDLLLFDKPYLLLGRHPTCDVRLDSPDDARVSIRHAAITRRYGVWRIRDLGSTHGTRINGAPLEGEHVLATGDLIELGGDGPTLRVTLSAGTAPEPPPAPVIAPERVPRRTPSDGFSLRRVLLPERREPVGHVGPLAVLVGVAVLVVGLFAWNFVQRARADLRREALLARADSVSTALALSDAPVLALRGALDSAVRAAQELRADIERSAANAARLDLLALRLDSMVVAERRMAAAVASPSAGVARMVAPVVIAVEVSRGADTVSRGTGVALASDAGAVVVLTPRHVVEGAEGAIRVRWGGTSRWRTATIAAFHPISDVALLQVAGGARMPASRQLADTLPAVGAPLVAVAAATPDGVVAPLVAVASVTRVLPDLLYLDDYGAPVDDGMPLFDSQARLAALVAAHDGGVVAVPARQLRELLRAEGP